MLLDGVINIRKIHDFYLVNTDLYHSSPIVKLLHLKL